MQADPQRLHLAETGIYIRAKINGKWSAVDLAHLDRESAKDWLESNNERSHAVALILLGHAHD